MFSKKEKPMLTAVDTTKTPTTIEDLRADAKLSQQVIDKMDAQIADMTAARTKQKAILRSITSKIVTLQLKSASEKT